MDFSHQACQKESQRMMPVLYGTGRKTQVIPAIFLTVGAKTKIKNFILKDKFFRIHKVLIYSKTLLLELFLQNSEHCLDFVMIFTTLSYSLCYLY
jgi:hypothetical protein